MSNYASSEHIAFSNNLVADNEQRSTIRDVQAEKIAAGHYASASTYIPDDVADNNLDVVIRDGSRQAAGGTYHPGDIVMIEGMEMLYETAVSMGYIKGNSVVPFAEVEAQNAARVQEATPIQDSRPDAMQLATMQVEIAMGDNAAETIDTFAADIISNGEISAAGLEFAQRQLGMNAQAMQNTIDDITEAAGQMIHQFLEVGDGLSGERIDFLVDLAETGTAQERRAVRQLWTEAATGRLSKAKAEAIFDRLYAPYVD